VSDSVKGLFGGVVAGGFKTASSPVNGVFHREKLSSDQHTLSRRNAALARRFPV
ncbi:hypothetical protein A2U01_0099384, partial [Trifolium medium]|nr:hypothetical protein [Trifolium medium]